MGALSYGARLRSLKPGATADPVYYFHGDEDVLKDEAVRALVELVVDPSARDFNLDRRSAAALAPGAFHSLVNTPPMLAPRRVVVLRGLEDLKKTSKARQEVLRYLARPSPTTLLVLVQGAGTPPDPELAREATTVAVEPLPPARVLKWMAHQARQLRLRLDPDAAELLAAAVGNAVLGTALARAELDRGTTSPRLESVVLSAVRAARPWGVGNWQDTASRWARWATLWSAAELRGALQLALTADRALKSSTVTDERGILMQLVLAWGVPAREAA